MSWIRLAVLSAAALVGPASSHADVPRVVADTAPVHSLVALVMGDLGTPALLIPAGTSPHDADLRPADAAALAEAEVVIWTGPAFLPQLADSIATLAPEATSLALLETDGWPRLPLRSASPDADGAAVGAHDHGAIDPHAWLDPLVATIWIGHIEQALLAADPDNAALYAANSLEAVQRIDAIGANVAALGALSGGRAAAVGHDAYAYFEDAAGLAPSVPFGLAEGGEPRAADATRLARMAEEGEVACLVLDAEADESWGATLGLRTVRADPDGVLMTPGPDLYPALMQSLTDAFAECLQR